jgi:hypothetical protein
MQILLAVTLVFAVLWFVALRPKSDNGSSPATTTQTSTTGKHTSIGGLGRAIDKANGAKTTADQANKRIQGATGGSTAPATPGGPGVATPGHPVPVPRKATGLLRAPEPILQALSSRKVVALLFYNPAGADDQAVLGEFGGIDTHGGQVVTASDTSNHVSNYSLITRSVPVLETPQVIIVNRSAQATVLTGYNDVKVLDQAVRKALTGH